MMKLELVMHHWCIMTRCNCSHTKNNREHYLCYAAANQQATLSAVPEHITVIVTRGKGCIQCMSHENHAAMQPHGGRLQHPSITGVSFTRCTL